MTQSSATEVDRAFDRAVGAIRQQRFSAPRLSPVCRTTREDVERAAPIVDPGRAYPIVFRSRDNDVVVIGRIVRSRPPCRADGLRSGPRSSAIRRRPVEKTVRLIWR